MDHFEMVEKLRERTGVSYEDAKAALERADWDLLDAIVLLEAEGKVDAGAKDYSTRREESREEHARKGKQFKSTMGSIGSQFVNLVDKGNKTYLDVTRNGKNVFSLPLTVIVVLMIFMFWWMLPLLVVGLFFGYQYSIRSAAAGAVNSVMDKASELASNIKTEVQSHNSGEKHE